MNADEIVEYMRHKKLVRDAFVSVTVMYEKGGAYNEQTIDVSLLKDKRLLVRAHAVLDSEAEMAEEAMDAFIAEAGEKP